MSGNIRAKERIGSRFGKIVVESVTVIDKTSYLNVVCDCGSRKTVLSSNVVSGKTSSCGCAQRYMIGIRTKTHGMTKSKTHRVWTGMINRCTNKRNKAYGRYGGRGIVVCDRWRRSFSDFLEDMGEAPDGMSLDRIDNNGPYCKSNCRWATRKEQANNRRSTKKFFESGAFATLSELCEKSGVKYSVAWKRLKRGWSLGDALTIPVGGNRHV